MPTLHSLIQDPAQLTAETLPQLRTLVERYPYCQTARLLMLNNLFSLRHKDFGPELRRAALMLADRRVLFRIAESAQYELPTPQTTTDTIETETDINQTINLIDNYLDHAKTTAGDKPRQPSIADLTHDYTAFLANMDDLPQPAPSPECSGIPHPSPADPNSPGSPGSPECSDVPHPSPAADLIDNFIASTQGNHRLELSDLADDYTSPTISYEQEEVYTENMVNIYIKQGRYKQALEILRKICLNNPKKNTTFAAQIQLLEVILGEKG